jgi:hypothetical protein
MQDDAGAATQDAGTAPADGGAPLDDAGDASDDDAGSHGGDDDAGSEPCPEGETCADCGPGLTPDEDGESCVLGSPPTDDALFLWLDADDTSSILIDPEADPGVGRVTAWTDARGAIESHGGFIAPDVPNRPTHVVNALNGRRVMRFDGVDDWLSYQAPAVLQVAGPFEGANEYTIFLVGYAAGAPQVLLSGSNDGKHGLLLQSDGEANLRFLHRTPLSGVVQPNEDNLITTGGGYSRVAPQIIIATRTATAHEARLGATVSAVDGLTPAADAFEDGLLFTLARLKPGATASPRYLLGDIAEVLVYTRALSEDEREQVEAYLAVKWGFTE